VFLQLVVVTLVTRDELTANAGNEKRAQRKKQPMIAKPIFHAPPARDKKT
jgi:hypothetical protein